MLTGCAGSVDTTVDTVDGTATYTSASMRATLTGLMTTFRPSVVGTLDTDLPGLRAARPAIWTAAPR